MSILFVLLFTFPSKYYNIESAKDLPKEYQIMKPISPVTPNIKTEEITLAKDQEEYQSMPAVRLNEGQIILSRWELTDEEIENIKETKSIWVELWTFGSRPQPMLLSTEHPILLGEDKPEEWPDLMER